ncbi:MAG: hypothetical protein OXE83_00260 [Gammaproteobacteria bacterium]|nr:hypothetical protein [Gammaproteobacteria bacterium]
MEEVDDLDGAGEVLVGEVPDPGGAVAERDAALGLLEAAALDFAQRALGERGRVGVGVAAGDALDGRVERGRAGVPAWGAVRVKALGGPDGGQLGLAGLGGAVGPLAGAALRLAPAHRQAGAVEPHVEGVRRGRTRFDRLALVALDDADERHREALNLLGADPDPGQLAQHRAGAGEAGLGGGEADHAPRRR